MSCLLRVCRGVSGVLFCLAWRPGMRSRMRRMLNTHLEWSARGHAEARLEAEALRRENRALLSNPHLLVGAECILDAR